ncbi:MAG: uncharacterized protein JWN94_3225 [Betaproteobacteria bacterium]|nr:uncharacterized protein [Betaproteobacteria bacterium]
MDTTLNNADRVRANTSVHVNRHIDEVIESRVRGYAQRSPAAISERIGQLEREWDIERMLQFNASVASFTGLALGITQRRSWFLLPGIVLPFLFLHAVQGWCPPLPVLRKLGVRTRSEIERERYALKALRGDFSFATPRPGAEAALQAVKA